MWACLSTKFFVQNWPTMYCRSRQFLLAAVALCAAALIAPPLAARAAGTYGVVGYDISWPQCGGSLPSPSFDVAVIGVTGGHGFSTNPCLSSELAWSRHASLPADVYINVDLTQTTPSEGANGPRGTCAPGDLVCYGYNYGYNNAQYALSYALSTHVTAQVWWLDVETNNNWATNSDGTYNNAANASDIQGALDAVQAAGKTVGTYSTSYQWGLIAGASYRPEVPVWYAGAANLNQAAAFCDQSHSFTGGPVWLTQYNNGTGYDGDYACTNQVGWTSLAGPHFALITSPARGSSAIAINDNLTDVRDSTGSSFGPMTSWSSTPFFGTRATEFADIQGPGKPASAVAINDSSVWVMLNQGSSFASPQMWSSVPFYGSRATVLADVDGSGRASVVAVNDASVWVMLNNGTGFDQPRLWSNGPFYGTVGTYAAVVDGTRRASIVAVNTAGIWVLPNAGGTFGTPRQWSTTRFFGGRGTFLADVDGSGRVSAVAVNDTSIWVESNAGAGSFGSPQQWATGPFYSSWEYVADIDGSGRASVLAVGPGGIWVRQNAGGRFGSPQQWFPQPFNGTH